ncbi:hypothetical protein C8035_v009038 [Colletotrichum spinosum]|uniref:Uncharacterized protein n=1 Tax=Colletotrichum spinosum TaxID=1347390 RepID=A0A4R8QBC8_9PEZI|nr:hypothetical protein C8035_v009038 [Colletotrichum spinosum]
MARKRASSTLLLTAARWALILTKLAALACILVFFVCGSRIIKGDLHKPDDILGKSFSIVTFTGIAARDAGTQPPYLAKAHLYLNSLAWEFLQPQTGSPAVGFVYTQPLRPLQLPSVLHNVADALRSGGYLVTTCGISRASAPDDCIRASAAYFEAFDAAPPLTLQDGPAFVLYIVAFVVNVVGPVFFRCLAFFRDYRISTRWMWFKAGVLAFPAACQMAAASLLTSNAASLVTYLNQFPDIPSEAALGTSFFVVAWCGVLAELLATTVGVARVFIQPTTKRVSFVEDYPSESRLKPEFYS